MQKKRISMTDRRVCNGRKVLLFAARWMAVAALIVYMPAGLAQTSGAAPATASAGTVHARGNIAGDWQGTLQAEKSLRIVLKISKSDKGWDAMMYSIDQGAFPIKASSVTLNGSTLKFSVEMIGGNYEGTLSADGNSIAGTWTQGPNPLPLTLIRTTKETAWEIPAPPPPPKLMAADADPSFDVATIKPNNSGGTSMQGLYLRGRSFSIRNGSLADMVAFAYNVHKKQLVNGPGWMDNDRFDID
jgi:hypothetical protein